MSRRGELNRYLDGRMTPRERAAFEERLAADPTLAVETTETRRTLALLRGLPEHRAPAGMVAAIMAEVRQEPVPARLPAAIELLARAFQPSRLAMAAVAVVLVVGTGLLTQPRVHPLDLSVYDEAFVEQCLRDYYVEASKGLTHAQEGTGESHSATGLEF